MLRALKLWLTITLLWATGAQAASRSLPFSGRLVDDQGQQIAGPVDLKIGFYREGSGGEPLSAEPMSFAQVALTDGVFHIIITFGDAELKACFPTLASIAFLQVQDVTHDRTYHRQKISQAELVSSAAAPALPAAASVASAELPVVSLPGTAGNPPPPPPAAARPPTSNQALTAATGACLAASTVGAKFVVKNPERAATCASTCTAAKSGSQCLRGWTYYLNDQVFEFGNECGAVQLTPNLPAQGHLCCCLAQSMPMPIAIELPATPQP